MVPQGAGSINSDIVTSEEDQSTKKDKDKIEPRTKTKTKTKKKSTKNPLPSLSPPPHICTQFSSFISPH